MTVTGQYKQQPHLLYSMPHCCCPCPCLCIHPCCMPV